MDMADGNFMINQEMLEKKNGSKHADRNDKTVFPLGRSPDLGSFFTSLHYLLIRLKPRKFILNIGQPKSIFFGSTSISLYGLWALKITFKQALRYLNCYDKTVPNTVLRPVTVS